MKAIDWIGSSKSDLEKLPNDVQREFGYALYLAQVGGKHEDSKPLSGFGGAGILEVVENYAGDTYRAVYTVRLVSAVYVLHVFQKKSKSGIKTPQRDIDLIKGRLRQAELDDKERRNG